MLNLLRFGSLFHRRPKKRLVDKELKDIFQQARDNFPFKLLEPAHQLKLKNHPNDYDIRILQTFSFDAGILFGEQILAEGWLTLSGDTAEDVHIQCTFEMSLHDLVKEELLTGIFRVDEERGLIGVYDIASAKWHLWVD